MSMNINVNECKQVKGTTNLPPVNMWVRTRLHVMSRFNWKVPFAFWLVNELGALWPRVLVVFDPIYSKEVPGSSYPVLLIVGCPLFIFWQTEFMRLYPSR
eukprot:TRINITY_DN2569_c0_g1_i1.p1 TRINITY_DN2569_c0_g1~~TRINITY_DN2569_c0_g1_i1.p1  ORF type:complete len:100 (-),score=3.42 TRINITY_DN2569_c0_g1_i1:53-352(-)